jgi:transcriptional regulator with XRE-family HTH domain
MKTFGAKLRALRQAGGLTQEALARAAGVSTFTVAKLERLPGQGPTWGTVQKLARALGVDTTAFEADPGGVRAEGASEPPGRDRRGEAPGVRQDSTTAGEGQPGHRGGSGAPTGPGGRPEGQGQGVKIRRPRRVARPDDSD